MFGEVSYCASEPRIVWVIESNRVKPTFTRQLAVASGALIVFSALDPTAASTQESPIPLDTVTAVGTRLLPGLSGQTRAVEVLDRDRIESLPARTIAQVLDWALAVDVLARSPAQADISIRGSGFEQVLVLIDGVRVSDPQTGHFDMDLALPLDQVERIEILRGPASAQYGTDAMGGVVNVVTRAAAQSLAGRVEAGSFGTLAVSLGGGIGVASVRLAAGGGFSRSDGHREGTDYRVSQLQVRAEAPLASGDVVAQIGQSWKDFGAADFYAPYASYEETRTTRVSTWWRRLLTDAIEFEPHFYLRRHRDHFILDRQNPEFYANSHLSSQVGAEAVIRHRGSSRLKWVVGGSLGHELLESSNLGDRSQNRWAVFGEAATSLGPIMLSAGLRGDVHQGYALVTSPTVSATAWLRSLRIRGSFGGSFRAPNWTERYYEDPYNKGRADLKPERSWTSEIGADLWATSEISMSLTAYRRRAVNLIDWARDEDGGEDTPWQTRNVESATFRGLEATLNVSAGEANVSIQGSVASLTGDHVEGFVSKYALRPLVRDLVAMAGRSFGPVKAHLSARHRRRQGEAGYWLLDMRLGVAIRVGEFYLDLLNGLGVEYQEVTGVPAPGRSLILGYRSGQRK